MLEGHLFIEKSLDREWTPQSSLEARLRCTLHAQGIRNGLQQRRPRHFVKKAMIAVDDVDDNEPFPQSQGLTILDTTTRAIKEVLLLLPI